MIRDREQALNPPGIDAPERKIVRQYIPMREYNDIEANRYYFICHAQIVASGTHDQDLSVEHRSVIYIKDADDDGEYPMFPKLLDSYISPTGPTWRELIEREICRQAALLPSTAWEVEYEGD